MELGANMISRLVIHRFISFISGSGMLIAGATIVFGVVLMAIFAPLLTPYSPIKGSRDVLQPPSSKHLLGTNNLGYDMLSRILYGARTVLIVVLAATMFSMLIGVPLGLISGYYGGYVDRAISMVMDSMYAFPSLILAIAIAAVLGPSMLNTIIAISIVYVPTYYRMVRGQTLSLKSQLYVEAARALGAKSSTIISKYIFPNLLPTVLVVFSMNIADAILTEAGLSFLGFSVPPPTPDWGADLRAGQAYLLAGYWWLITFPGFMVILLAVGFALIGEGLSDILNPRREGM